MLKQFPDVLVGSICSFSADWPLLKNERKKSNLLATEDSDNLFTSVSGFGFWKIG